MLLIISFTSNHITNKKWSIYNFFQNYFLLDYIDSKEFSFNKKSYIFNILYPFSKLFRGLLSIVITIFLNPSSNPLNAFSSFFWYFHLQLLKTLECNISL